MLDTRTRSSEPSARLAMPARLLRRLFARHTQSCVPLSTSELQDVSTGPVAVSGLKPRCEGARLAVTQPQVDVDRVGFPFSGYGIAETKRRERIRPKMKEFPANSRLSANWRQRLVDLELVAPVTDPGLGIDQFQNAHALEIGHRPLARERPL